MDLSDITDRPWTQDVKFHSYQNSVLHTSKIQVDGPSLDPGRETLKDQERKGETVPANLGGIGDIPQAPIKTTTTGLHR